MGIQTFVFPGPHLVTQLVDCVKYDLRPGCQAWPRRVSLLRGEAQLAGCQKGLARGPFEWNAGVQ